MAKIVVIGGGHNGLVAATKLAGSGHKVTLLERRESLGGLAAREEFAPGFFSLGLHHDTSTLREEIVKDLHLARHGLRFYPSEPPIFVPQEKGRGAGLLVSRSPAAMQDEPLSERDKERYAEFRKFMSAIAPVITGLFNEVPADPLSTAPSNLFQLARTAFKLRKLGRADMLEFFRIAPMCVADWLNEWFENPLLKCALSAPAFYGSFTGPWSPGNTSNLLIKEATSGKSVTGGAARIIEALSAAARDRKVDIRLATPVEEIIVRDGVAAGVRLRGGEELGADRVVSTLDPKTTFLKLVPSRSLPYKFEERVKNFRSLGTTAKVNIALKGELRFDCRPNQRVEFARTGEHFDEIERAFDHVKYREFSARPVLDIFVPTVSTPDAAPAGHSTISILAHFAPYNLEGGWSSERTRAFGENVLAELERYSSALREQVVEMEVLSPKDIEERYGCAGGHIFHGEHALDQLIVRPSPECAHYLTPICGLYQCGSGSHPGGGITGMPGYLGAAQVA